MRAIVQSERLQTMLRTRYYNIQHIEPHMRHVLVVIAPALGDQILAA